MLMRNLGVRTVSVICLFSASCTDAAERTPLGYSPTSSRERPMTSEETGRFLLEGPRSFFVGLPDYGTEVFLRDGVYLRNGFPSIEGRYTVRDNRVCIRESEMGKERCRDFFVNRDGPHSVWVSEPEPT